MKPPPKDHAAIRPADPAVRLATAEYLAGHLPDLVRLADRADLELVAYLLDVARLEAEEQAQAVRLSG